jgi:hypothetical protein
MGLELVGLGIRVREVWRLEFGMYSDMIDTRVVFAPSRAWNVLLGWVLRGSKII